MNEPNSGVARGRVSGGRGPRAAHFGRRHFANKKLNFKKSLKFLDFPYYFKIIFFKFKNPQLFSNFVLSKLVG